MKHYDLTVSSRNELPALILYRISTLGVGALFLYIAIFKTVFIFSVALVAMLLFCALFFWAFPQISAAPLMERSLTFNVNKIAIHFALVYIPLILLGGVYVENDGFRKIVDSWLLQTTYYLEKKTHSLDEVVNAFGEPAHLEPVLIVNFFMNGFFQSYAMASLFGLFFYYRKYVSLLTSLGSMKRKLGLGFFKSVFVGGGAFALAYVIAFIMPGLVVEYQNKWNFSSYYMVCFWQGGLYSIALMFFQIFVFNLILRVMGFIKNITNIILK